MALGVTEEEAARLAIGFLLCCWYLIIDQIMVLPINRIVPMSSRHALMNARQDQRCLSPLAHFDLNERWLLVFLRRIRVLQDLIPEIPPIDLTLNNHRLLHQVLIHSLLLSLGFVTYLPYGRRISVRGPI